MWKYNFDRLALVRRLPCELNIPYTSTTAESRAGVRCQWDAFSPPVDWAAVRSGVVILLLLTFCLVLLPLWESVIILCFVVRYFISILVLQSS